MKNGYLPLKTVEKKWGREEVLSITDKYCLKKITIFSGCKTSLQYHNQKEETNVIHSGEAIINHEDLEGAKSIYKVGPGYIFHLKPKEIHRIEAVNGDVLLYEASTADEGFQLDVIRIEDAYGREGTNEP